MTAEEQREDERQSDIQHVLSTESGRRFLWRILSHCGIYRDIHKDSATDAARELGRRSVGLWTLQIISEKNEETVFKMMREAKAYDILLRDRAEKEAKGMDEEYDSGSSSGIENFIS